MSGGAAPCALGLDFGTASCRAVLVETSTGRQCATAVSDYRHGVIDRALPESGAGLGADWALQHPSDYLESMTSAVTAVMREAGIPPDAVIGLGLDFTASTILPIDAQVRPLCLLPDYVARPHAWVKLWKHHAAQSQADRITALAAERGEAFLADYGGRTSSEWLVAKVLQILDEDPAIYDAAAGFVEAGDWLAAQLTGTLVRNACGAGYKGFWSRARGFPSAAFFSALDARLGTFVPDKLPGAIRPPGQPAGGLTAEMAARLGLRPGTAVAVPIIDAHAAVPAATVVTPGRMVMVIGTSTCHMVLADRHAPVEGMAGVVADGIVEGFYGYEAGQAAVGDIFGWFVRQWSGRSERDEAAFAQLDREAAATGPGGNGLVALDWWNGNRSVLANADLSGLVVGLTLQTTAAEIYRSLIEATAFGTRRILASFEAQQIAVSELIATGDLAERSPLLLQIYADVTRRPIRLVASANASALGAAMLGAVAASEEASGHASFRAAAEHMASLRDTTIEPNTSASTLYDDLYREYLDLHDHFGRGGSDAMSRLRCLRHA